MEDLPKMSLQRLFEDMDDPRVVGRCSYSLKEVVLIAICAVLSGAESWTEIEEFGVCNHHSRFTIALPGIQPQSSTRKPEDAINGS